MPNSLNNLRKVVKNGVKAPASVPAVKGFDYKGKSADVGKITKDGPSFPKT
jgi:hypothetical protein